MSVEKINPKSVSEKEPVGYTLVTKATGVGSIIFVSGQIALDKSGKIVGKGDIETQLRQVWTNIRKCLESVGATFKDVVKMNAYLVDMKNGFASFKKVRSEFIGDIKAPAFTLVEVKGLSSPDLLVEIEAIAVLK